MFGVSDTLSVSARIFELSDLLFIKEYQDSPDILRPIDAIRERELRSDSAAIRRRREIDLDVGIGSFLSAWTHLDRDLDKDIIEGIGDFSGYGNYRNAS